MAHEALQNRCRGALVGVVVGDAIGADFEGRPGPIPSHRLRLHLDSATPAAYTDDTAMTVAVCESMLHSEGLDEDHLAETFSTRYEREPHRGYGAGTADLLHRYARGGSWRSLAPEQFAGAGSYGNGAAMRSAPFGLWTPDPQEAAALARRAAVVTHTHPVAVDAAGVQAAAVAAAIGSSGPEPAPVDDVLDAARRAAGTEELRHRLERAVALRSAPGVVVARDLGTSVAAIEAVPAAIAAFLHHPDSFADVVVFAIALGGDTDTIASMAGAITGARLGVDAIPPGWVERCEGTPAMHELADRFFMRRRGR